MKQKSLLDSVFSRLRPRLFATARGIVRSDEEARDVLQDAFCRLWERRDRFADPVRAEQLSVTAVKHTAIDSLRRKSARGESLDASFIPEAPDDDADENAQEVFGRVKTLIDSSLTERQRSILYMRDYKGMEIEDIAEIAGTSEANVRLILSRARKMIRELYKNQS